MGPTSWRWPQIQPLSCCILPCCSHQYHVRGHYLFMLVQGSMSFIFFLNWGFRDEDIFIATIAVFFFLFCIFMMFFFFWWLTVDAETLCEALAWNFLVFSIFLFHLESFYWLLSAKLSWKLSNIVTLYFLYSICLSDFPTYCLTKTIYFNSLTVFKIAA